MGKQEGIINGAIRIVKMGISLSAANFPHRCHAFFQESKMKKMLFILALLTGLAVTLTAAILTNPSSGVVNVGDPIGARVDCLDFYSYTIYWGDGTSKSGSDSSAFYYAFTNHVYRNPGTYQMHFHRNGGYYCTNDEYRSVTILENRFISISPVQPGVGQPIVFTAVNFQTPANITWDMGDGTTYSHLQSVITHTYQRAGSYTVRAFDWNGDMATTPVTLPLAFRRAITFSPALPRVDEPVDILALGFQSDAIDWDFGDGSPQQTYSAAVSHRYQNPGAFIITAREHGMTNAPATQAISILPENRSLALSTPEARTGEPVTVTAVNFRGPQVLWDFGDGASAPGPTVITHAFKLPGSYTITARDENGASDKKFQAVVRILGISDQVNLEIAEITLDNGKYYKVVPKNSKNIRAKLNMKMRGTGIVSGYWIVDGQPYQFFNETVYQGQIKTILTREIPGLPAFDPGMHTVTVQLTRPAGEPVVFQTLRYFVLPFENEIAVLTPRDGAIMRENHVTEFTWESAPGGSYYQIAYADSLLPLLANDEKQIWLDCPERFSFTPDARTWGAIRRNQWTYWKVRALDSGKNIVAESGVMEMKIIVVGAQIGIEKISDMDGHGVAIGGNFTSARADYLLIQGTLTYPGDAEYLIVQVYANDGQVDRLLFRDVKNGEVRRFETSVPNLEKESSVIFEVLKSSSPSVVIGFLELKLKRE
jgi:PKD repeat protein